HLGGVARNADAHGIAAVAESVAIAPFGPEAQTFVASLRAQADLGGGPAEGAVFIDVLGGETLLEVPVHVRGDEADRRPGRQGDAAHVKPHAALQPGPEAAA